MNSNLSGSQAGSYASYVVNQHRARLAAERDAAEAAEARLGAIDFAADYQREVKNRRDGRHTNRLAKAQRAEATSFKQARLGRERCEGIATKRIGQRASALRAAQIETEMSAEAARPEQYTGLYTRMFGAEAIARRAHFAAHRRTIKARARLDAAVETIANLTYVADPKDGIKLEANFAKDVYGEAEDVARKAGFLRRMVANPTETRTLRWLINSGYNGRGMGSPGSDQGWINKMLGSFSSPEAANRHLCKVIRYADRILRPYGVRASTHALRAVMERSGKPNKRGREAAQRTLQEVLEKRFSLHGPQGRAWNKGEGFFAAQGLAHALKTIKDGRVNAWIGDQIRSGAATSIREAVAASSRLVEDNTDHVVLLVDPADAVVKNNVSVVLGYQGDEDKNHARLATKRFLVQAGARSYHVNHGYTGWGFDPETSNYATTAVQALQMARAAWRKQDEAMETAARRDSDLRQIMALRETVELLVYKDDSYAVGNCQAGTEAWMQQMGLKPSTPFASLSRIQSALGFWRLDNTVRVAAKNLLAQLRSQQQYA